jgi:hypothetical protein
MNAEQKKEYRLNMPDYQKAKYLEYIKRKYHALTPDEKADLLDKKRIYYQENKEKIRAYQRDKYYEIKSKPTAENPKVSEATTFKPESDFSF